MQNDLKAITQSTYGDVVVGKGCETPPCASRTDAATRGHPRLRLYIRLPQHLGGGLVELLAAPHVFEARQEILDTHPPLLGTG